VPITIDVAPAAFLQLARNELGIYDTVDLLTDTQVTNAASGEMGFEVRTSSGEILIGRKVLIATCMALSLLRRI